VGTGPLFLPNTMKDNLIFNLGLKTRFKTGREAISSKYCA
jgi:hypothetical protein